MKFLIDVQQYRCEFVFTIRATSRCCLSDIRTFLYLNIDYLAYVIWNLMYIFRIHQFHKKVYPNFVIKRWFEMLEKSISSVYFKALGIT